LSFDDTSEDFDFDSDDTSGDFRRLANVVESDIIFHIFFIDKSRK